MPTLSRGALEREGFEVIVPGHCTGWRAQHALAAALPDAWAQTSVGTRYTLSVPG
jgi:7,8-dihydropterin-6-yl-methyl-4-(beta-D-ribofuranosyl)aminobenzene 5'-phosphate synthase